MPQKLVLAKDVYQWPEFKAFAERLGIVWEASTVSITITLPTDGLIEVSHQFQATDKGPTSDEPQKVETTNLHNAEYRTFIQSDRSKTSRELD
jgi:hypothetical protein